MNLAEGMRTRLVVGLCATATLLSCTRNDDQWVEKRIPGDQTAPTVTSAEVAEPASESAEPAEPEEAPTVKVPKGMRQLTFDLPAARSRNVEAGMFIDVFVVFNKPTRTPDEELTFVGSTTLSRIEVARNTCDERTCSLTVFVGSVLVCSGVWCSLLP